MMMGMGGMGMMGMMGIGIVITVIFVSIIVHMLYHHGNIPPNAGPETAQPKAELKAERVEPSINTRLVVKFESIKSVPAYCPMCGSERVAGAYYCTKCGAAFN